jgi:hypothetical protein
VATPSKQTSTLRKDECATPKAPNKSVAGTRNIVQADIKVSFMGPQDSYESQATNAVCSNLYPSGRDADATDAWLAPPTVAITSGDSQGTPVEGRFEMACNSFTSIPPPSCASD